VGLFGRRDTGQPVSIETEQERLLAIRVAAEDELGRLRRELTERVAAVEQRERELADALTRVNRASIPMTAGDERALDHARVGLAAHAGELTRRERELAARESALLRMETDLARRAAEAAETPEERLAHIEERIAALQEAEQAFARTQAELAARSEALASREAALAEQELAGAVTSGTAIPGRAELAELDERLRRLERQTREAAAPRGFGDDLRALQQRGLRGAPPSS
jgi:DNA repair exonuclease SbcCD ATPase subunit